MVSVVAGWGAVLREDAICLGGLTSDLGENHKVVRADPQIHNLNLSHRPHTSCVKTAVTAGAPVSSTAAMAVMSVWMKSGMPDRHRHNSVDFVSGTREQLFGT